MKSSQLVHCSNKVVAVYIVVGLGNPGDKYAYTRHNIGFIVIDMLAEKFGIRVNKIKHKAVIGEGMIAGEKVVLAKPQTYMNSSGESVLELYNWYKVDSSQIVLIYDDIDLDIGTLRIRPKGSAGTHNGMRSVIYHLQTEDFPRIRIGVGSPSAEWDLKDYVLSPFSSEELPLIEEACKMAVMGVELIVSEGVAAAMNQCNGIRLGARGRQE